MRRLLIALLISLCLTTTATADEPLSLEMKIISEPFPEEDWDE